MQNELNQLKVGDYVVVSSLGIPQCVDIVTKTTKEIITTKNNYIFNRQDGTAHGPSILYKASISVDVRDFKILELRHTLEAIERKIISIKTSIYSDDVSDVYRDELQVYFSESLKNLTDLKDNMLASMAEKTSDSTELSGLNM